MRLQPYTEAFGSSADVAGLREIVERFEQTERGREVMAALGERV